MFTGPISTQGYKHLPFFFFFSSARLLLFSFCQWRGIGGVERVWRVGGGRWVFPHCPAFRVVPLTFFQHFTLAEEADSFLLPTSFQVPRISLIVLMWRHHNTGTVFSSQKGVPALGSPCADLLMHGQ